MPFINWKETYDIGFRKIDEQHLKLIDIINELHEAHTKGTGQMILGEILDRLVDYTIYHFDTEEELFKQYEYPKAKEHLVEHKEFTDQVTEFLNDSKTGNLILTLKTMDYLKDWTITHILGTDKEFGDFVREKELGV